MIGRTRASRRGGARAEGRAPHRLDVRALHVRYQGVSAVAGVHLGLEQGEILGVIGPNGAGKTSLVNAIAGMVRPVAGSVTVSGVDVTGWPPARIARHGVARTFQSERIFGHLTVLENVAAGGVGVGLSRRAAARQAESLLERLGLSEKSGLPASGLAHGEGRRLGIGRAIATQPLFLLLDEPAAGLDEAESAELMKLIFSIRDELSCGTLIIDHDMRLIMGLCDRIQVLDYGKSIAAGSPEEIRRDPLVIGAYLGTADAAEAV